MKSPKCSRKQAKKRRGQTLVEYALSILLVIGVFTVINRTVMRGIGKLWKNMAVQIASGCPTCTPPEQLQ